MRPDPELEKYLPAWHEGDGPAPYVFSDKPRGHRCAWSCDWTVPTTFNATANSYIGGKMFNLQSWRGLGEMTVQETICELEDISFWHDPDVSMSAYELLADQSTLYFMDEARAILATARQRRKEYLAVWITDNMRTADGQRLIVHERPGWGKEIIANGTVG